MGGIRKHLPVKLFAAIAVSDTSLWPETQERLETMFSAIDSQMEWYDFHHTDYYRREMGAKLQKRMVSFKSLIDPADLPRCKISSNHLESEFVVDGHRRVNIDPGYLCAPKVVLATTKDYSHRIYLSQGIFGDLHLVYQNKRFVAQPWTYPDYQEPFVLEFFASLRDIYLTQLAEVR